MTKKKLSRDNLEDQLVYLTAERKLYVKRNKRLRDLLHRQSKRMLKRTPELRMLRRKCRRLEKLLNKFTNSKKSKKVN